MTNRTDNPVVAVVDDDASILRSLEYLLESASYSARLFTSAKTLLQSGVLKDIVCLVTDLDMPGIDGFNLLGLVHAARPDLPVILITGYPERIGRVGVQGDGGWRRVFTKPFNSDEFLAAVNEAARNMQR